jgi:hypothetical protein
VVGEQPIYREMFESLAEQMDYLGLEHVAEIHPTQSTGCTMRSLRHSRWLWASRNLQIDPPSVTLDEWLAAAAMLSTRRNGRPARAP